ncbi:RDD family protein [Actinomadura parmotrematis]|uniref:RDD family protein n=1 Tax=Actinomadura parmotrematis TaxID=2864039 RepID=A0ABS7FME3_9ACTN|nr:RDD family protein [Actinomadura parmotrematis]MBW8481544.1 RDD family protein [Actinomadura parmotrematis]
MTQPPYDPEQPQHERPGPYQGSYGDAPGAPGPYDPAYGYGPPGHADPAAGLAGRWRRLGAAVLDSLLIGIVGNLVMLPFPQFIEARTVNGQASLHFHAGGAGVQLLVVVAQFFYYVIMHARFGQTLGKMALSIRVVREDDGGAVSFGQAAWRSGFNYLISLFTCGVGGLLDIAWILWDPRRQALHDKVAKTLVVAAPAGAPNPYAGR